MAIYYKKVFCVHNSPPISFHQVVNTQSQFMIIFGSLCDDYLPVKKYRVSSTSV